MKLERQALATRCDRRVDIRLGGLSIGGTRPGSARAVLDAGARRIAFLTGDAQA